MKKTKFANISEYLKSLINISNDCDAESTIQNISQNIEFKGVNVWILVFAIFLASIGLNVNSTAVIIGAMLVSPLMGPIMGCGLAIGISDLKMLKKSLKNLLVMTIISLLVSTLYFTLTPLSDAQSELLARTRPTIFDVMIASFGGFAGIVASSRKKEMTTVVSGVAIATALMPPLCTAGFGLGTGQINYFFGAFYLFFINSFFIALATFLIVKYLHFPELVYVDEKRRKNVRRTIAIFSIIVITPSIFMAINVVQEAAVNSYSRKYISDIEQNELFPEVQIIKHSVDVKAKKIELAFVGKDLTDEQTQYLHKHLIDCSLDAFTLSIKQAGSQTMDLNKQSQFIQDLLDKKDGELMKSDSIINELKLQISDLQVNSKTNMSKFAKELTALRPSIKKFTFGKNDQYNMSNDSVVNTPIITLYWETLPDHANQELLESWIRVRLENPAIIIENKLLNH
ncbi:MAG: TIGR00341 family protein [Bacteroidales bacterium]|nr:TIGR00341 family protein [Bacteroidales bacterium]MBR4497057.1 TIGR00341 family protein [Bacteroidales bacterium]